MFPKLRIRNKRTILIRALYIGIDVACVSLAIYLACWLRRSTLPFSLTGEDVFFDFTKPFHPVFLFWLFAILFFNNINDLYQTRRELLESIEIWQISKSVVYSGILTIVAIYGLKVEGFPRSVLILTGIFLMVFLSVWRVIKRVFVEFLVSRGYNNFNVLIIGAGKIGTALAGEIEKRPGLGLRVTGYLDDFKSTGEICAGHKVLGKITSFAEIAQREFINKLFITIHHDSQVFLQILEQARDMKIAVRVVPQGFEFTTGEFSKYNIGFIPVLEYCEEEHIIKQAGKRLFDFVLSSILILLAAPIFIALGVMIKADSPGAVFYQSQRYGRKGRRFKMYKFRSMVCDAESNLGTLRRYNEVDGPIFKIRNDPRITRLGRFLRKYSLDELPQLFNVWKGEMSLVGPRPLPIDQIEKEDIRQLKRLEVRPGITGLWQIRGRSDISFARLVKWDIWYINNWSFWLDLNILYQTIPTVMKAKGAY